MLRANDLGRLIGKCEYGKGLKLSNSRIFHMCTLSFRKHFVSVKRLGATNPKPTLLCRDGPSHGMVLPIQALSKDELYRRNAT